MKYKELKHELRNIISGKGEVRHGATIQAVANYLRESKKTGEILTDTKQIKSQETKSLIDYSSANNLFLKVELSNYVSQGAEQKVYLKNDKSVIKLNDSIYYESWSDYFTNLLLHNFFFPDTAYKLLGFYKNQNTLYAVIEQPFVLVNSHTNLNSVKTFLEANGFVNNRNNDYINHDLGVIIEDLHDENVLTKNNILYFIDTVFYLTPGFYTD